MNFLEPIHWAILLLFVACALGTVEVFLPSGGILGFMAAISAFAAVSMAFYHHGPVTGFAFAALTLVLVPTCVGMAIKYWPQTALGKKFFGELPTDEQTLPDDQNYRLKELVGRHGVAKTSLLPAGAIEIDGRVIDAVSRGEVIEQGEPIKVVEVRAYRVMVRRVRPDDQPALPPSDPLNRSLEELGIEPLEDPLA